MNFWAASVKLLESRGDVDVESHCEPRWSGLHDTAILADEPVRPCSSTSSSSSCLIPASISLLCETRLSLSTPSTYSSMRKDLGLGDYSPSDLPVALDVVGSLLARSDEIVDRPALVL